MKRFQPLAAIATVLAFIGSLGLVAPACIGWFYKPQVPEILRRK